jgi:hypothetical protein
MSKTLRPAAGTLSRELPPPIASMPTTYARREMASIRIETTIDAPPEAVWDAVRDWGAVHEMAAGFVTETRLDGDDRIVTFVNGMVARERLVDVDDEGRRLVWSVVDGPFTHHNASAQVFAEGEQGTRFVWIADLLPDELATRIGPLMEQGTRSIKQTLESARASVA